MPTISGIVNKPSDALKILSEQYKNYLAKQTGLHGDCTDCSQPIPKSQLCVTCPECLGKVCILCVDLHRCALQAFPEKVT